MPDLMARAECMPTTGDGEVWDRLVFWLTCQPPWKFSDLSMPKGGLRRHHFTQNVGATTFRRNREKKVKLNETPFKIGSVFFTV
jgi:hypothetical protein